MSQTKTQSIMIANGIRSAIQLSNQARELRKSEAEALRFVPEGAHFVGGQWYEVKRFKLAGENHPDQKVPRFTKVIRKITATRAQAIGPAVISDA